VSTLDTGRLGEEAAAKYLQAQGYNILERNYRTRWFEIDIIAEKKDKLVFVEVRTKAGTQFGLPEETIDCKKLGRLIKAAYGYLAYHKLGCEQFQIDAVCIVLDNCGVNRISHYENITL
jgi:putative endonuclease